LHKDIIHEFLQLVNQEKRQYHPETGDIVFAYAGSEAVI